MFSNNVIEAIYLFKGLYLNHEISTFIRDFPFFGKMLFIMSTFVFVKKIIALRGINSFNLNRNSAPITGLAKFFLVILITSAMLGMTTKTSIYDFKGYNWKESQTLKEEMATSPDKNFQYYDISTPLYYILQISRGIEYLFTSWVDQKFNPNDKFSENPNGLYKAFFHASYAQITDPQLRSKLGYFQEECINPILPKIQNKETLNRVTDSLGLGNGDTSVRILNLFKTQFTSANELCTDVRNSLNSDIRKYLKLDAKTFKNQVQETLDIDPRTGASRSAFNSKQAQNIVVANALSNYLNQKQEERLIVDEAELDGSVGKVQSAIGPWLALLTLGNGAFSAAEQSVQFSEMVKKMPHIKGFIMMVLLMIYPFLVFFIVWYVSFKTLSYWSLAVFIVSMWTPVWALLYSVTIKNTQNAELLYNLQNLSDHISIYSAKAIGDQMYKSYTVFFVGQMGVVLASVAGPVLTFFKGTAADKTDDNAPSEVKTGVSMGAKYTSGGLL